jgi:hypothetical protein
MALGFPKPHLPPWAAIAGLGFLEGFLSQNKADTDTCIMGVMTPVADAKAALEDLEASIKSKNYTDFEAAFKELDAVVHELPTAMQQCNAAKQDIATIEDALKNIKSLSDFIAHIKADFAADTSGEIAAELELTVRSFEQKQYDQFGSHAGKLLHRLLVGAFPGNAAVIV